MREMSVCARARECWLLFLFNAGKQMRIWCWRQGVTNLAEHWDGLIFFLLRIWIDRHSYFYHSFLCQSFIFLSWFVFFSHRHGIWSVRYFQWWVVTAYIWIWNKSEVYLCIVFRCFWMCWYSVGYCGRMREVAGSCSSIKRTNEWICAFGTWNN